MIKMLIAVAALALAGQARADVTYTYTGNLFVDATNSISGSFTVPNALAAGLYSFLPSTPGFSAQFSDGTYDYSTTDPGLGGIHFDFVVYVKPHGVITNWDIRFSEYPTGGSMETESFPSNGTIEDPGFAAIGELSQLNNTHDISIGRFAYSDVPGNWTAQPVPEPSTYAMLIGGLMALTTFVRRRIRKL